MELVWIFVLQLMNYLCVCLEIIGYGNFLNLSFTAQIKQKLEYVQIFTLWHITLIFFKELC